MRSWLVPLGLFLLAALIRLAVAAQLPFPTTEPSAYYADVARNVVAGNGLVSDSIWSYATGPLTVPKPAFALWLPMSSFLSAVGMSVLGSSFWSAQVVGALFGALLAPLTWLVAREASRTASLGPRRGAAVALAAGILAAILAPFVAASVVPDSTAPFTVFMVSAALLVPRVLGLRDGLDRAPQRPPRALPGLALGVLLGFAYLSRQEVIWMGLTVLLMAGWVERGRALGTRLRDSIARLWPVVAGGLVVVTPWLVRNALVFGSPFPGQAIENAFLQRNEDVFAFAQRPSLAGYLDQGLATVLGNPIAAIWDALLNVLVLPAFPIGVVGILAVVAMWRTPIMRRPTAWTALLISGAITLLATTLLFPVATLWGTFRHASGPLLVALTVAAVLGGDALLARISAARHWEKPNAIIAPIALIAVAGLLSLLQVRILATQSTDTEVRYAAVAAAIDGFAAREGVEVPATVISDHPVWLAQTLGRGTVALPDEGIESIMELAKAFETHWLVVIDELGRYPASLLTGPATRCLARQPIELTDDTASSWLFVLADQCEAP